MTKKTTSDRPMVYKLYDSPMKPEEIEAKSFNIIDQETTHRNFSAQQWEVARRMIHTTANFDLLENIRFSKNAIDSAVKALSGRSRIYVDSNMARSGISMVRLRSVNPDYEPSDIVCHVADEDIAVEARKAGLPRSLYAVRKAKEILDGGIAVFGNAPVALLELNKMIMEENVKPALVIGLPVGFVHVLESKEELMSLNTPYIVLNGRLGGSTLAVSVIHALCTIASEKKKGSDE